MFGSRFLALFKGQHTTFTCSVGQVEHYGVLSESISLLFTHIRTQPSLVFKGIWKQIWGATLNKGGIHVCSVQLTEPKWLTSPTLPHVRVNGKVEPRGCWLAGCVNGMCPLYTQATHSLKFSLSFDVFLDIPQLKPRDSMVLAERG